MKSYLKKELSTQCHKLGIQLANMDVYDHRIPQIELDIFLRNIQDFYEKAVELKTAENDETSNNVAKEKPIEKAKETENTLNFLDEEILKMAIAEDIKKTISVEKEEEIIVETIVNTETQNVKAKLISDEIVPKVIEDKQAMIDPKPPAETVIDIKQALKNEPIPEDDPSFNDLLEENPSREDLFSNVRANQEILDLNRKLAEARGNHSLAEKLQNQQIENLKSVIGINDKFYFINELFDGDSTKYEDVIYTLNNFKRFDDALQYFSTLKYRFNWNEESEAPAKLIKMLERKFNVVTG